MTSDVKVWEEDYLKDIRLGKGQKKITIESVIIGQFFITTKIDQNKAQRLPYNSVSDIGWKIVAQKRYF